MPLLSICIPTYNRAPFLADALRAIADQLNDANCSQVEIVISDNASTDDTQGLVARFAAQNPHLQIVYFRQSSNVGSDGNVNTLLKLACSTFVYFLADDDILLPQAITRILSVLQANPTLEALCLNVRPFLNTPDEANPPEFTVKQDRIIHDRDEALVFLGTWITFLSTIAFRREVIAGRDYTDKIGTNFIQSYMFVDVLVRNGGLWITSQPFLAVRANNPREYNFFQIFVSNFFQILEYAEQLGYSKRAIQTVLYNHRRFIFGFVLTFKVRGVYGDLKPDYKDGIKRLFAVYHSDPIFLFRIIPAMLLPQVLVPPLRQLSRLFKRIRATLWNSSSCSTETMA